MKLFSHAVALVILLTGALCATSSVAAPALPQHEIKIDGKSRRYFHLTDTAASYPGQTIILVSGSGCDDFSARLPTFFALYPAVVNVYYLEKSGVKKGADGSKCSVDFSTSDQFDRRLSDHLKFTEQEPDLKKNATAFYRRPWFF